MADEAGSPTIWSAHTGLRGVVNGPTVADRVIRPASFRQGWTRSRGPCSFCYARSGPMRAPKESRRGASAGARFRYLPGFVFLQRRFGGLQGSDMNGHDHMHSDPAILAGKPVVRGTQLSVDFLLDLLANGWTLAEVLESYPQLSRQALCALFAFAAECPRRAGLFLRRLARHEAARGRERPARDRDGLAALRRGCSRRGRGLTGRSRRGHPAAREGAGTSHHHILTGTVASLRSADTSCLRAAVDPFLP